MAANLEEVLVTARTFPNVLALPVSGAIGDLKIETTIEETHTDVLHVTEHPVESGASITDHSFKKPSEVVLRCGWSNASLAALGTILKGIFDKNTTMARGDFSAGSKTKSDYVGGIYSQLLAIQSKREPVTLTTSLREYDNMLITSLRVDRDQKTSQVLMVTATLREVIIVSTRSATLPPQDSQATPANTSEVQNVGTKQAAPAAPAPGGSKPSSEWAN